jgi:hypothetical protein
MFTKDNRLQALRSADPVASELYCSIETGELLEKIYTHYSLPDIPFINIVGDIILGLYQKHELRGLLRDELALPEEKISAIVTALDPLLSSIPSNAPGSASSTSTSLVGTALPHTEVAPAPLTRDELMKALEYKPVEKTSAQAMTEKLKAVATEPKVIGYDSQPPRNPQ